MRDQSELEAWAIAVDKLDCDEDGSNPVDKDTWSNIEKRLKSNKPKKRALVYAIAASLAGILMTLHLGQNIEQGRNTSFPKKDNAETVNSTKNHQNDQQLSGHVSNKEPIKVNGTNSVSVGNKTKSDSDNVVKSGKIVNDSTALQKTSLAQDKSPAIIPGNDLSTATVKHDTNKMSVSQINNLVKTVETSPGVTMKPTLKLRYFYLLDKIEAARNDDITPANKHKQKQTSTDQN